MDLNIRREGAYEYIEEGDGHPIVLLHGLFGALSNWRSVLDFFSQNFKIYIPLIPIYRKSTVAPTVQGFANYIRDFMDHKGIRKASLLGNSLGGHIGLVYTLANPERVHTLTLTASSGLFESGMGSTFPRRSDYSYIKQRVEYTFYDPGTATRELVDEVYDIVNDNYKALRVLKVARDAQRHYMGDELGRIRVPTLLIWGLNDNITPTHVAHEFRRLLPNSELHFVDRCGHAPMMERPERFNEVMAQFLRKHT